MPDMVYIMTNAAENNEVAAFQRMGDGSLTPLGLYSTGGAGSGPSGVSASPGNGVDPLMSQGSLVLSPDGRFLFTVNADSNSISSLRISADGSLALVGTASAGEQPVCLSTTGNLLYAAHAGSRIDNYASGVMGFTVGGNGSLTVMRGSERALSMPGAHPAGIVFSPDGRYLVVSELTTNRLSVFGVGMDGMLSGPVISASNGQGPFGSVFLPSGLLLTAEAGTNALTSYRLAQNGTLQAISTALNRQMATCWVAATPGGRHAYTTNAASGTVSTYNIMTGGALRFVGNVPATGRMAAGAPIDCGVSPDGRNFYALNGNQGSVSAFSIDTNGRLMLLQVLTDTGLPSLGTQGLAVM